MNTLNRRLHDFESASCLALLLLALYAACGCTRSTGCRSGRMAGMRARLLPIRMIHAHLYLGTATGWIYESRNGGADVEAAGAGWEARRPGAGLTLWSISADPKHILVGAWVLGQPGRRLYVSDDGGGPGAAQCGDAWAVGAGA